MMAKSQKASHLTIGKLFNLGYETFAQVKKVYYIEQQIFIEIYKKTVSFLDIEDFPVILYNVTICAEQKLNYCSIYLEGNCFNNFKRIQIFF